MNQERWLRALGLILFVGFGLGVAVYLLGNVGTTVLPSGAKYNFEADVVSSDQLANAADVREAGVEIGRVTAIKRAGTITALELSIDKKYGPVYHDATVLIRAKSVAGENYVQLDPGNPKTGAVANGGVLPISQESPALQDDDVFSIFEAKERDSLQQALKGLGAGLSGSGGNNLNRTLESMTALVEDGQPFATILNQERGQTAQLINAFDGVAGALGERAADIQTLTRTALSTANAVSARNADLRATIASLPAFLAQTHTTANRLGGFSTTATPVLTNLKVAFQDLIPAVQALRPASLEADTTLATLKRFATVALPTFNKLTPFSKTTTALIKPYSSFLQQLNPFSAYMSPYYRELSSWFSNTAAGVEATDSIGHLARVTLPISRSNYPTLISGAQAQILKELSGGLDTRGTDAYPEPGSAAAPAPLSRTIPPLTAAPPYDAKAPAPIKQ